MKHFPISVNYAIDISDDQLKRLVTAMNDDETPQSGLLYCRLMNIPGVLEADYNDLSATIFITVKSTFDHQLTWKAIWTAIYALAGDDTRRNA